MLTGGGGVVECDLAVVGVGVEPAVDCVAGSALELDDGIVVDAGCRTGVPGVVAAGDVARQFHPLAGRHIRVEHWRSAIRQGEVAARSLLGEEIVIDDVPWFWSDQYDCNIQYAGIPGAWDAVAVRGSVDDRRLIVFLLRGRRLVAAVTVNEGRDLRRAMKLIAAGAEVDPAVLADPGVDLRTLAPTVPGAAPPPG